jgi:hypothetical protein
LSIQYLHSCMGMFTRVARFYLTLYQNGGKFAQNYRMA